MYHIKNDKRAHKSAALISENFLAALEKKPYKEITVAEICVPNRIARTTFYRLFDTLDDVLLYQLDRILEEGITEYMNADGDDRPYALFYLDTAMQHPALIRAAVDSGRYDLFRFASRNKNDAFVIALRISMKDADHKYCMAMLNAICFSALRVWVENNCKETSEEVYHIVKNNLDTLSGLI